MSLIFAIDNDKRQSAQLASLLRAQVNADLIQSASASEGLAVLQNRVPDLILTSTFLSPRDETALASYLRDLGGRGAHVQTLTIPLLATDSAPAKGRKKKAGMLGALRREKTAPSLLEGCSPDAFASEVQQYLVRALERRATEPEAAGNVLSRAPEPWEEPGPAQELELPLAVEAAAQFDSNIAAADPALAANETPLILLAPLVEVVTPSIVLMAPAAEGGRRSDAVATKAASLESTSFLLADEAPAPESSGWTLVTPPTPAAVIAPLIVEAAAPIVVPLIIETVEARAPVSFAAEAAAKRAAAEAAAAKRAAAEAAAAKRAAAEAAAAKRAAAEAAAAERAAAEAAAAKRAAAEAAAAERAAAEAAAAERAAAEAAAAERAAAEAAAAERAAAEAAAAERAAAEAAAAERAAAEAAAAKRAAAEAAAAKRAAAEAAAAERAAAKAAAAERAAAEAAAAERAATEAAAAERAAAEAAAAERAAAEAAAAERAAAEAAAAERAAAEAAAAERAAAEAAAAERAAAEAAAAERAAAKAAAAERAAAEAAAAERAATEAAAAERAAAEAAAAERAAAEAAAAERAAAKAAEAERAAAEAAAAERAAAEAAAAERAAAKAAEAERAAAEAAEAERAAAEAAAAEADAPINEPMASAAPGSQAPGFGDIYMDATEPVAETAVDLSPAAVAAGASPAEGDVPLVEMGKADDLDALSSQLAGEQSLFVPEPVVPEVPAAVFLKDMPPLDSSIFVDAPEPVPAMPLVDQPYAGLAFEDIFLSAKDRKRAVAATGAPEQTATFDAARAPEPEPAVVNSVAVEAAESIETATPAATEYIPAEPPAEVVAGREGEPAAVTTPDAAGVASLDAPPMDDAVAANRIDEPEAQAIAADTQASAGVWTLEAKPEAAPEADTRFSLIEADMPMAETPAAGTSATVPVEAKSAPRAWSWMDSEASTPLADILAAVAQGSARAEPAGSAHAELAAADQVADALAAEPVAAAVKDATPARAPAATEAVAAWALVEESVAEEPVAADTVAAGEAPVAEAPVAEVIAAPVIREVFNPDAVASWNAAIAFGAVPVDEKESPAEPNTIEEVAAAPAPVMSGSPVVSGSPAVSGVIEVHDPIRAAAWRSAMAGHVADVPSRTAVTVPALVPTAPEPDTPPTVDEWGGQTGPTLGEEFLALIGNAARQASLDAFDALDGTSTPEPAPERRERPRLRPSARGNRPVPPRKERRKKPRPAQDEWGMFDPEQCGPDALLDDDAWEEEPDDRRPSPRGRSAA